MFACTSCLSWIASHPRNSQLPLSNRARGVACGLQGVAHLVISDTSVMVLRTGDVSHLHPMLEATSAVASAEVPQGRSLSYAVVSALPVLLALNSVRVFLSSRL
eukprot:m.800797 g.800797  ORF g.800797 m.800797 type:complete len:104 (-) comp23357_c0_seq27:424-735(-)